MRGNGIGEQPFRVLYSCGKGEFEGGAEGTGRLGWIKDWKSMQEGKPADYLNADVHRSTSLQRMRTI
jgi:hypothetical protein